MQFPLRSIHSPWGGKSSRAHTRGSQDVTPTWRGLWHGVATTMVPVARQGIISVKVPQEACAITTPLVFTAWRHLLIAHPNRDLTHFFLQGIAAGFRIGYNPPSESLKPSKRNMQSALQHPEVVDEYLAKEQQARRVRGPFNQITIPEAHTVDSECEKVRTCEMTVVTCVT